MANAAGVDQSGLSGLRSNYSSMNNGNNTRDRLMEQQYNPYIMPMFNSMGGQNPELGRYRPPMMGKGGGWQDQGGYSYNLPNSFGPYYGAPMSGFPGGGGIPPWMQGRFGEPQGPIGQGGGMAGAQPKPIAVNPGIPQRDPSMYTNPWHQIPGMPPMTRPPQIDPMTVSPGRGGPFGNIFGAGGENIQPPTREKLASLQEALGRRRMSAMPIFGR